MGFQFNGTQANVTINSSSNYLSAVPLEAVRTSAGTTDMGTVGAGKRWRILSAAINTISIGGAVSTVSLEIDGVALLEVCAYSGAATTETSNQALTWNILACPVVLATKKVQLVTSNTQNTHAQVTYVEESV